MMPTDKEVLNEILRGMTKEDRVIIASIIGRTAYSSFNRALQKLMEDIFPWLNDNEMPVSLSSVLMGVRALHKTSVVDDKDTEEFMQAVQQRYLGKRKEG